GTQELKVSKQCQGRSRLHALHCPDTAQPVENDEIADRYMCDVGADRLDHPGGLVAEENRVRVGDAAVAVRQVGVVDAASPERDDSGSGITSSANSTGCLLT